MVKKFEFDTEGLEGTDDSEESAAVSAPTQAQNVIENLYEPQKTVSDQTLDDQMRAVEERLEVAQHYKALMNSSMFPASAQCEASQRVDAEIQGFVRQRLEILMGVRAPVAAQKSDFDTEEVKILKALVQAARNRSQKLEVPAAQPPGPPTVVQVDPKLKPQVQTRQQQVAPIGTVPPRLPAKAPVQARQQVQKPASNAANPLMIRVPEEHKNNPTLQFKEGRAYVQVRGLDFSTGRVEPLWTVNPFTKAKEPMLKDVTMPARPPPGLPQPMAPLSDHQFNMVMDAQGSAMINHAEFLAKSAGAGDKLTFAVVSNLAPTGE